MHSFNETKPTNTHTLSKFLHTKHMWTIPWFPWNSKREEKRREEKKRIKTKHGSLFINRFEEGKRGRGWLQIG